MGNNSKIEWTDHTFNPWRGCTKVSDGCKNCYAENMGRRFGVAWGPSADRIPASEAMWKQPLAWDRAAARDGVRRRVFCSSMADVFDDHPSIKWDWQFRLWEVIRKTKNLDWLLLTKRPENFYLHPDIDTVYRPTDTEWDFDYDHVMLGISICNMDDLRRNWEYIYSTPANMFLSIEPLLGEVDLNQILDYGTRVIDCVDWVICGGETGPCARPMNLDWARSLRDQCADNGVPFFFKSTGGREKSNLLDGRTWEQFPA